MNGKRIKSIRMLGTDRKVTWKQSDDALLLALPDIPNTNMTICFAVH